MESNKQILILEHAFHSPVEFFIMDFFQSVKTLYDGTFLYELKIWLLELLQQTLG